MPTQEPAFRIVKRNVRLTQQFRAIPHASLLENRRAL